MLLGAALELGAGGLVIFAAGFVIGWRIARHHHGRTVLHLEIGDDPGDDHPPRAPGAR